MPRRARVDAPSALYHIICRGIELHKIFWEDCDREDFLQRLETILVATQTAYYAWALLLLRNKFSRQRFRVVA